ncbi:non-heme chloroperoxidase [Isoptericola jiangsuensis]|uniref:Non-heme chloroperoxidase n=1 Tax=Isoptericola jiangsuensis TaxID=548579 RepID=A0A2A9ESS6_9MICO|nr:alpha/beta hydrolase [Isoptericola jiangsuensis]PFG42064.1 non-heme chloroperoxidase [Isoptericola jiangsuensis]
MPFLTTPDGTDLFYKDWGTGSPVVFSHGWPLNADAWDRQMFAVVDAGFRAVAHDRRGHGRSTQTADGNHMDQYADDLAALLDHLDLTDVVLVGHSTGGGEVAHYLGRHGSARVRKAVLLGAVPPLMVQTPDNPAGTPKAAFDDIRAGVLADRSQFYRDLAVPFYGANRDGATVSQGTLDQFWRLSMQAGLKPAYDCVEQFSEVDYTDDLRTIDVPVLVAHGDDDQIVPIEAAGLRSAEILADATLHVYPGAPHGLVGAYEEEFTKDLVAFVRD